MNKKGFTLIELLVVITVIGILSTALLAVLNPLEQIKKSRDAQRKSNLSQIQKILDVYNIDHGAYPATADVNFGSQFFTYGVLPDDPITTRHYGYESVDSGDGYRLFAKLERCSDSQILDATDCQSGLHAYNYSVTSPNIAPGGTAGLGPTAEPTATPTETPIPSNTPTPTLAPKQPPCSSIVGGYGDTDGNGMVDKTDSDLILQSVANSTPLPSDQNARGHVTSLSGTATGSDSQRILRYLSGIDNTFPICSLIATCASSATIGQTYTDTTIVGCNIASSIPFAQAQNACGTTSHVCNITEYLARGGNTTTSNATRWLATHDFFSTGCGGLNQYIKDFTNSSSSPAFVSSSTQAYFDSGASGCGASGYFADRPPTTSLSGTVCCK